MTAPGRPLSPDVELLELEGGCGAIPVRFRRHPRARRLSARIDPRTAEVTVTVPRRSSRREAVAFVRRNAGWAVARLSALPEAVRLEAGATVPLGGVPHAVRHAPEGRGGAWLEDGAIAVSGEAEFVARRVADFLRGEARRRLGALAGEIAEVHGLRWRRFAIKDTRSRWGSCTAEGTVMFNWRLVMAPPEVQHYVVAHELAHLRHLDHGPRFWAEVAAMTPHLAYAEDWLKRFGAGLLRVG